MKRTVLAIAILFCSLAVFAQAGPVPLPIGWTPAQTDYTNYHYRVRSAPYGDTNAPYTWSVITNVVGKTNCLLGIQIPSDAWYTVTVFDPSSSYTNWIMESTNSNVIRIRSLGNSGNFKVTQ